MARTLVRIAGSGLVAALLCACTTTSNTGKTAFGGYAVTIASDLMLHLPESPGLKEPVEEVQTIIGSHDQESRAFQAHISGDSDRFEVIILAISGPRIMEIVWSADGIEQEKSVLAPDQLDALNILADIFLVHWPEADVRQALPSDITLQANAGSRTIEREGLPLIEIAYDVEDNKGHLYDRITNHDRRYSLSIYKE